MDGSPSSLYEESLKSVSAQVERPAELNVPISSSTVSSRVLKFGVDRILSDDIRSDTNSQLVTTAELAQDHIANSLHHFYISNDTVTPRSSLQHLSPASALPSTTGSPPCSSCVSSMLRCCSLHMPELAHYRPTIYTARYCSLLHNPKPVRPYTNLIFESEFPSGNLCISGNNSSNTTVGSSANGMSKRKRSWSRAVFSNLQRKGLEKRFQIQKYITKPDRRQLAATLGLTDAQVKVWFQNRRMKWRHSKELKYHNQCGNSSIAKLTPTTDVSK
ncbi:H2.0-like homeobox protein [Nilaparvata lugens]|uniref:H2.0-like homeobox protein n=1 Tax=Nilaparvata lugens TaxID=108931 RepID=UPI000B99503A|nr:H2.0-like homeobox protein [Nilaparvata lugens]